MRKFISTIFFIFLFFSGYCQSSLTLSAPSNSINIGTTFSINVKIICNQQSCGNQILTLNIGNLEAPTIQPSLPTGSTATFNNTANTITVTGLNCSNTTGFSIQLFFPKNSTCSGISQAVSGRLNYVSCPQINSNILNFTPTIIQPTVSIQKIGNGNVCFVNDLILYRIYVNKSDNGYNIENENITVSFNECIDYFDLYHANSYSEVSGDIESATANTRTITWSDSGGYNQYGSKSYDLYVRYPCLCRPTNTSIQAIFEGNLIKSNCTSIPFEENTTLNVGNVFNDCATTDCNGGTPSENLVYISGVVPCPETCSSNTNFDIKYYINIPLGLTLSSTPGNNGTLEFITNTPLGLDIESIDPLSTSFAYTVQYSNNGTDWYPTSLSALPDNANNVKFVFTGLPSNGGVSQILINYNYVFTSAITTNQNIVFGGTIKPGNFTPIVYSPIGQAGLCNTIQLVKSVKLASNSSDIYTNNINVMPRSVVTYQLNIINMAFNAISGVTISDILNNNNIYQGNFRYAYVDNNSPSENDFIPITNNSINIVELFTNNVAPTVSLPDIDSSGPITISGITLPPVCGQFFRLFIRFDASMSNNLLQGTIVTNTFTAQYGNGIIIYPITEPTQLTINGFDEVDAKIYAKCPREPEESWTDTSVNVMDNESLDLKIRFENKGSRDVTLQELLNLKPMNGDNYVSNTNVRGSEFNLNYKCIAPVFSTNHATLTSNDIDYQYSNNNPSMQRTFCTSTIGSTTPVWDDTCEATNSNWMKVVFPNNTILAPGNFVEIVYRGKISGAEIGESAKNSFSFKAQFNNQACIPASDREVIININELGCPKCINCASFALQKEEKYLVSAWVKEEDTKYNTQLKSFDNTFIKLSFTNANGTFITLTDASGATGSHLEFHTSGTIIDGWQRIIGEFIVPGDATTHVEDMNLELVNNSGDVAYFDDVRVLPSKGNMKSFVYDQKTQRLMAELDENNYATFYEYDLEGGLIRIKKETEKGVFTIQETRSGNVKATQD